MTIPEVMTLLELNTPKDNNGSRFTDEERDEKIAELDMTDEEWRAKHGTT